MPHLSYMDGVAVDKWFELVNDKLEYAGDIHLIVQLRMNPEYQRVLQEKQKAEQHGAGGGGARQFGGGGAHGFGAGGGGAA